MIDQSDEMDLETRAMRATDRVIRPARVYFKSGEVPAPVELREVVSVRVEIRFQDTLGRPERGGTASLHGGVNIPGRRNRSREAAAALESGYPLFRLFGPPGTDPPAVPGPSVDPQEGEQVGNTLFWSSQSRPDDEGRVVFRVPEGATNSILNLNTWSDGVSLKYRRSEKAEWSHQTSQGLGVLFNDLKGLTVVCARAPTTIVAFRSDSGELVAGRRAPGHGHDRQDALRRELRPAAGRSVSVSEPGARRGLRNLGRATGLCCQRQAARPPRGGRDPGAGPDPPQSAAADQGRRGRSHVHRQGVRWTGPEPGRPARQVRPAQLLEPL